MSHLSCPSAQQVRAINGLEGVAYLQPGVMAPATYVFGKVIEHLKDHGYNRPDSASLVALSI